MTLSRAMPFVLMLVALPLGAAQAQFGGGPGMPGMPGAQGFGPPQQPPAACQQLMVLRDETAKHAQAIGAASKAEKKPPPDVVCKLFKSYLASEAKMIKALETNATTCGVPPDAIKQVKLQHNQAGLTGKQVCEMAARPAQPAGPSLSDALGTTPLVPEHSERNKQQRGGAFDTLTGNVLQR